VHQLVAELERLVDARLDHPALAAPLGAGIVGNSAYLAQQYVAADSLDSVVREYGAAPPADALRVAAQLAGALDFAGVVNIAHGAMHPRDILLSSDETRLTGIGVARALENVGVAPPVRRPYTAPERSAGGAWDRRADVFSLAAVTHELLWGRRPAGTGARAADALGEIEGGDLPALRSVFTRALADEPQDRYDTALEFVQALTAAFPDVTLTPPEPREPSDDDTVYSAPPSGSPTLVEPRLPLDLDTDPESTIVLPHRGAMPLPMPIPVPLAGPPPAPPPVTPHVDVDALAMLTSEEQGYQDVEAAPAIVPEPAPVDEPTVFAPRVDTPIWPEPDFPPAMRAPEFDTPPESALDRSRSAVWPLGLALAVGLAVGFAGGYGVGSHSKPDASGPAAASAPGDAPASTSAVSPPPRAEASKGASTPAPAGREFTENTVPAAPKAATPRPPQASPTTRAAATAASPAAADSGRLLVRSTPSGANVSIDGKDYGRTPAAVRDLSRGPHRLHVTRDGYGAVDRRVVITPARPSQSLTIALAPADATPRTRAAPPAVPATAAPARFAGSLTVDSRPAGAKVFVDGQLAGTTPLSIGDVRAGEHAIRIERDGYRRWSSSVRIVAAEQNKVTASLER